MSRCFSVLFNLFLIRACVTDLLDLQNNQNEFFDIQILSDPIPDTHIHQSNMIPMRSKFGQQYWCDMPHGPEAHDNDSNNADALLNHTRLYNVIGVMKQSDCLLFNKGWWTYKLCVGSFIEQYHLHESSIQKEAISYLGYFEKDYDWSNSSSQDPERIDPHHSQFYSNGTLCDLTGQPRQSIVRFRCVPNIPGDQIVSIEEEETCLYIIWLETSKICFHHWLAPSVAQTVSSIRCAPVLSHAKWLRHTEDQKYQQAQLFSTAKQLQEDYRSIHLFAHRSFVTKRRQQQQVERLWRFWSFLKTYLPVYEIMPLISMQNESARMREFFERNVKIEQNISQMESSIALIEKAANPLSPVPASLYESLTRLRHIHTLIHQSKSVYREIEIVSHKYIAIIAILRESILLLSDAPFASTMLMTSQLEVLQSSTEAIRLIGKSSALLNDLLALLTNYLKFSEQHQQQQQDEEASADREESVAAHILALANITHAADAVVKEMDALEKNLQSKQESLKMSRFLVKYLEKSLKRGAYAQYSEEMRLWKWRGSASGKYFNSQQRAVDNDDQIEEELAEDKLNNLLAELQTLMLTQRSAASKPISTGNSFGDLLSSFVKKSKSVEEKPMQIKIIILKSDVNSAEKNKQNLLETNYAKKWEEE